jgi:hypothetical protein
MGGTIDLPESTRKLIVYGVLFYFALFVYASISGEPLAVLAMEFVFGVIAVGIGAVLYGEADGEFSAVMGAAVCLVAGGVLQFGALFTGQPVFDLAASLLVFVGIGLYVYVAWYGDQ